MSHFFYSWNYTLDISKQSQIILTLDIVIDYVSIQSAVKIVNGTGLAHWAGVNRMPSMIWSCYLS